MSLAGEQVDFLSVLGPLAPRPSVRLPALCSGRAAGWGVFLSAQRCLELFQEHLIMGMGRGPAFVGFRPPSPENYQSSVSGYTYSEHFI